MVSEAPQKFEDSLPQDQDHNPNQNQNQTKCCNNQDVDPESELAPERDHHGHVDRDCSTDVDLPKVKEEEGADVDEGTDNTSSPLPTEVNPQDISLDQLFNDVEQFLSTIPKEPLTESYQFLEIPHHIPNFLDKMNSKLDEYNDDNDSSSSSSPTKFGDDPIDTELFFSSIKLLSTLIDSIANFKSQSCVSVLLNEASSVIQRAMLYLEEELRYILAEAALEGVAKSNQDQTSEEGEVVKETLTDDQGNLEEKTVLFPYYSDQDVSRIRSITRMMILSGHEVECLSVFVENRCGAFHKEINKKHGFEKMSMDEVQKMSWDQLEAEVAKCNRALKHLSPHLLRGEHTFYDIVFGDFDDGIDHQVVPSRSRSKILFSDLIRSVLSPFIDFAHSIAMTKRSTEKLFKFLDMYEALREVDPEINGDTCTNEMVDELKTELMAARTKLGETAVAIFNELEMSIKNDNTKQPIPSGAVHPLIRYTMNYVKYACEYKDTLEQVFLHHHHHHNNHNHNNDDENEGKPQQNVVDHNNHPMTPFTAQLMRILDLLDTNLDIKSKLYKDVALRYVFLMNNGRYMLQKIRGSPEIHQVVRDPWCRRRSSDMRQYHKGYQRETWSRVLQCLNPEGLQVKGKVDKPVLKERFKNFNQQFDEIHKIQSGWVVSDEQLQSELRVSISAVMIPAYRGFLARYGQIFTPGRQYVKYIKYQPEDIENAIDELFDGNPNSMARRRS